MNIDIIIFLIFINIISFFICGIDKYFAIKRKYRISEKILKLICLLGGSIGFIIASKLFKHKTKAKKLLIFVYLTSIVWVLLLVLINI